MRKFTEMASGSGPDVKRVLLGGAAGAAVLCLVSLLFSFLVLFEILPIKFIVMYASVSGFLGGAACSVVVGARGKMLFYVPVSFMVIMAVMFGIGAAFFDEGISLSKNPHLPISVLFGLAIGSFTVNSR